MNHYVYTILLVLLLLLISYKIYILIYEEYGFFDDLSNLGKKATFIGEKLYDAQSQFFQNPKKAILSTIRKPPNKPVIEVANFVMKYANYQVVNIDVCREPVVKLIKDFMNALSNNQITQRMKHKNIEDLFHLYANITLLGPNKDIIQFTIEKNEVVDIKIPAKNKGECRHVNLYSNIKFADFINKGIQMNPDYFWIYNPAEYNCQVFINNLLEGNGLLTDDLLAFVNQNANELLDGLGFTKEVAKRITNLASNLKHYFDIGFSLK